MKRYIVMALVLSMAAVAAIGAYVVAADEMPGIQQGEPAVAAVPAAQTFTFKHPFEILAEVSGKSLDEISTLVAGKGVWEAAKGLNLVDKFTKAFSDYKLSMADYLVSTGELSKEDAEAFKKEFLARMASGELGNGLAGECGFNLGIGFGRGMMGGCGECGGCGMNSGGISIGRGCAGTAVRRQGMMGGRWF